MRPLNRPTSRAFRVPSMHLDKAKKRLQKLANKHFQGYPLITISYFGCDEEKANRVQVEFIEEEGEQAQVEKFTCANEVREDEVIQSAIIKIIERSGAKSVVIREGVTVEGNE